MNDSLQNDYSSLIHNYLQNEPSRHFGDLEYLKPQMKNKTIEILIDQLRKFSDRDTHFLLASKLFSQIITKEMAQYDDNLVKSYHFQQDFLKVYNTFYDKVLEEVQNQLEAEQRTAKILWNYIENQRLDDIFQIVLKNRDPSLSPSIDEGLLIKFDIPDNLVKIVQRNTISLGRSYGQSAYELASTNISEAIELFQDKNYNDMIVSLNSALEKIQEFEGNKAGAKFASIVGALLIQIKSTTTEGLRFLNQAKSLYEALGDNFHLAECYTKLSDAYWRQGMYKKTLDNLASEIDLLTKQNNNLAVMITEEKLSHFFRNLSRFNESQEWALRHLNSAIRAADDRMKGIYFLDANINYAQTLIGLNFWMKAEKHINFAERTINHLDVSEEYKQRLILEINHMKGYISVYRGQFDQALTYFAKRGEFQQQLALNSPIFSRFLRAEATLYRNLGNFPLAIKAIQPLFQSKDSLNPLNVVLLAELLALHSHESQALKLLNRAEKVFLKWNSIHGLSRIYLSMGYVYLLMQDFSKSQKLYQNSLEITKTDLTDLKVSIDANLNLAYIEMEKGNLKIAKNHCALAEECAMMSGSKAFILDSNLLKANLWINSGNETNGINALKRISKEAEELDIWFIQQKANFRLNEYK